MGEDDRKKRKEKKITCKRLVDTGCCSFRKTCSDEHGKYNKYYDHKLDLLYVTPRIIATPFTVEAEGGEAEDLRKVRKLLEENHG